MNILEKKARDDALERSFMRCQCIAVEHGHDWPCNREMKAKYGFAWKDDILRDATDANTFMVVCPKCVLQFRSQGSRIL
jgi:hypothetical protein